MIKTIEELLKRPIAYQPIIAKATESVNLAVLWSQIYYWSDRTDDPDGWVYKSRQQIFDETGLTRKQQDTARKLGAALSVLISEVRGAPKKIYMRVNTDKMVEIIDAFAGKETPKAKKAEPTEEGRQVNECIELFKSVNPNYDRIFKIRPQRAAMARMIAKHGFENVRGMVAALEKIVGQEFAPVITDPLEFERKLGKLLIYVRQKKAEMDRKSPGLARQ